MDEQLKEVGQRLVENAKKIIAECDQVLADVDYVNKKNSLDKPIAPDDIAEVIQRKREALAIIRGVERGESIKLD
jgi:hypothetical protein